jgi:hypothetical protein
VAEPICAIWPLAYHFDKLVRQQCKLTYHSLATFNSFHQDHFKEIAASFVPNHNTSTFKVHNTAVRRLRGTVLFNETVYSSRIVCDKYGGHVRVTSDYTGLHNSVTIENHRRTANDYHAAFCDCYIEVIVVLFQDFSAVLLLQLGKCSFQMFYLVKLSCPL